MAEAPLNDSQAGGLFSVRDSLANAADGNVTLAGGGGVVVTKVGQTFTVNAAAAVPGGYVSPIRMATTGSNDVLVQPFTISDSTDVFAMVRSTPLSINMPADLDTGAQSANRWYAVYAIGDTAGVNPVKGLLSLSFTSPTLPVGYDVFRRIGAVHNDGSSAFVEFTQLGRFVYYEDSDTVNLTSPAIVVAPTFTDIVVFDFSDVTRQPIPSTAEYVKAYIETYYPVATGSGDFTGIALKSGLGLAATTGGYPALSYGGPAISTQFYGTQSDITVDAGTGGDLAVAVRRLGTDAVHFTKFVVNGYYDNLEA